MDVSEIKNIRVSDVDFPWGGFKSLSEKIYQRTQFEDRAAICEQWLLQHIRANASSRLDHSMSLIYQSNGTLRVSKLSELAGWSSRHLNRMFRLHTGFSTKEFSQIVRIQNVCRQLWSQGSFSTNTINDLDYFDQSHLIKQWNKHFLSSPGVFWERLMSDFYNT